MKKIGILTSGGNASASNAAIHAVSKTCAKNGIELIGFYEGYHGLLKNKYTILTPSITSPRSLDNGSFLKSARSMAFKTQEGMQKALANIKEHELDAIIVIGGNGSLSGAWDLVKLGVPMMGIPATIDNDVPFTDFSLGVDTACNVVLDAILHIKEGAESILMENDFRVFLIEVMGRGCGYLTLASAISGDCDFALIPEIPFSMEKLAKDIVGKSQSGAPYATVLLAEGVARAADFSKELEEMTGIRPRIVVLGHTQRGGNPTHFDLTLAVRFGYKAVELLLKGEKNRMVALQNNKIVSVDLEQAVTSEKTIDPELAKIHEVLF